MRPLILLVALIAALIPAGHTPAADAAAQPRILVIGDSLLASHALSERSVGHHLSRILGEPVRTHPVAGARMIYNLPITGAMGLSIPKQFRPGDWQWVVLNGGGNDLWLGCGCNRCERKLDRMISDDGKRGVIPGLVSRIRQTGARVIYVGYLRSPGFDTPIENCKDEGDVLESRIARLAELDHGITFHSITDLVPPGDLSFHAVDRIHPSLKASRVIAERIARIIAED